MNKLTTEERTSLILRNIGVAKKLANKYKHLARDYPTLDDFHGASLLGLCEAAQQNQVNQQTLNVGGRNYMKRNFSLYTNVRSCRTIHSKYSKRNIPITKETCANSYQGNNLSLNKSFSG